MWHILGKKHFEWQDSFGSRDMNQESTVKRIDRLTIFSLQIVSLILILLAVHPLEAAMTNESTAGT